MGFKGEWPVIFLCILMSIVSLNIIIGNLIYTMFVN